MKKREKTEFGEYLVGQIKTAEMSQEEFDKWSKKHCEKCFFFKGGRCLFGKKKKDK